MNIVESITKRGEFTTTVRMQCGHERILSNPHVKPGERAHCPECPEPRAGAQMCTDAQLDAVTDAYAETMRARGFAIGVPEMVAIRRAAGIQDTWRVAFARVLK